MSKQFEKYYAAVLARDYRFDGRFFVGVKTTKIYCRPCLRCRPEAAPLSPAWFGKSSVVQRAVRLICDRGIQSSEEKFANQFGLTGHILIFRRCYLT